MVRAKKELNKQSKLDFWNEVRKNDVRNKRFPGKDSQIDAMSQALQPNPIKIQKWRLSNY
jgi:hypothetical protein